MYLMLARTRSYWDFPNFKCVWLDLIRRKFCGRELAVVLGAILLVSCSLFTTPEDINYILYPIGPGDTVQSIAARFDITVNELVQVNRIRNPRNLPAGSVLHIPYYGQSTARHKNDAKLVGMQGHIGPDQHSQKMVSLSAARRYIGKLAWPVTGAKVVSVFGQRWGTFHEGVDIAASEGVPILAAHAGQVVYSGDGIRGYGNLVVLKGDGILTIYGHNYSNEVSVGDVVEQGDEIAKVGQSGKATGPHLHFEVRVKDKDDKNVAVDPLVFYVAKSRG